MVCRRRTNARLHGKKVPNDVYIIPASPARPRQSLPRANLPLSVSPAPLVSHFFPHRLCVGSFSIFFTLAAVSRGPPYARRDKGGKMKMNLVPLTRRMIRRNKLICAQFLRLSILAFCRAFSASAGSLVLPHFTE